MSAHDRDDLARFFQRAAKTYDIEFDERDWNDLESRLNAKADQTKRARRRKAVSLVVLSLVTTGIFFFSTKHFTRTNQLAQVTKSSSNIGVHAPSAVKEMEQKLSFRSTKPKPDGGKYVSQFDDVNERADKTSSKNSVFESDHQQGLLLNNASINQGSSFQQNTVRTIVMGDTTIADNDSLCFRMPEPIEMDGNRHHESTGNSRWSILVSASPELSALGSERTTSPGTAIGAFAFYRFNNSLSFSMGATASDKKYRDKGQNFHPLTPDYWRKKTNGVIPDEVRGSCSMLEMSIGLQIDLIGTHSKSKGTRAYLGANISSYMMVHESYRYDFSAPNAGAQEGWSAVHPSYYLAATVGFAAGYEKSISNHISLGISPYVKIPVTGFGTWANVKLYSLGGAATLRYTFHRRAQMK